MYRPQLREVPTGPAGWWATLQGIVGSWHSVDLGALTVGTAERERLWRDAGLDVSSAVDQWAAFHGVLLDAGLFSRVMRDDYALEWHDDLQAVTLLLQGEGDLYWGIEAGHLADEDPPVTTWLLDDESDGWRRFVTWTPSTTNFVLTHILSYLHGSAAGFSVRVGSITEADDLLGSLVENRVEVHGRVIYEGTGLLGHVGSGPWPEDDARLSFSLELGEGWSGRIPDGLRQRLQHGGGMRHGAPFRF